MIHDTDPPHCPPGDYHRAPSTKPPEDESPLGMMRELRAALVNVGERMAKLEVYLMRQELAILTEEAQTHRANERLDELAERIRSLESRVPEAAE